MTEIRQYYVTTENEKAYVVDETMLCKLFLEDDFWYFVRTNKLNITPAQVYDDNGYGCYDGINTVDIDYAKDLCKGNPECLEHIDFLLVEAISYWNGHNWKYIIIDNKEEVKEIESFEIENPKGIFTEIAKWQDNYGDVYYTTYMPQYQDDLPTVISEEEYNEAKAEYKL